MITNFKVFETVENNIELKPSDLYKIVPMNSRFRKSEHETIANNVMSILYRTGNEWRDLSWEEYKKERKKDGNFSNIEKPYFNDVIRWCTSANNAKQFSPFWNIKAEAERDAEKYNL